MEALLDFDDAPHFTLGNSPEDWQHIVFERRALERFVQLARETLELRERGRRARVADR